MLALVSKAVGCPKAVVSVAFVEADEMQKLNKTFRKKDKPTDVLSFPQLDETEAKPLRKGAGHPGPLLLGDIVISPSQARAQASRFGNTYRQEMGRLLIHGFLHLLGHDHVHGGKQAAAMKREEERLWRLVKRQLA